LFMWRSAPLRHEALRLEGRAGAGIEIRRILLLTRLGKLSRGMTLDQLVKDCGKVSGWKTAGVSLWDSVRHVLQTLIDDNLVMVGSRFMVTPRGREYLKDPFKWKVNEEENKEMEQRMFWNSIYDVFDRAYRRLKSKTPPEPDKGRAQSKR
jgi:hypothetical protein